VTGNLAVTLDRLGTPVQIVPFVVTQLRAPLLSSVGGNVSLKMLNTIDECNLSQYWDFGMEGLGRIGGSLSLVNPNHSCAHTRGLGALTRIRKDLNIDWTVSDYWEAYFLPSLTRIDGDFVFQAHSLPEAGLTFSKLARVDGNLVLKGDAKLTQANFSELTHVGKDFRLDGVDLRCDSFAKLTDVGGLLQMRNTGQVGNLGPRPQAQGSLALGGVIFQNNPTRRLPFRSKVVVSPGGTVRVTDNVKLCQCEVDAFVKQPGHDGWSGTPVTSGNKDDASCTPCPSPSCQ
jgi:hypothetical protein